MKWTELQNIIVAKLPLLDDAAEYKDNMLTLANECLILIANSIKPCTKKAIYHIMENDIGYPQKLPEDFLTYSDYGHCRWYLKNYNLPYIIDYEYPDKFEDDILYVRLKDCQAIMYHNGEVVDTREDMTVYRDDTINITYTGERDFVVPLVGTYEIQYEGLYTRIEDPDVELDIPMSILNIIPYYVAGDLLYDEDPNKAIQYKNTFEIMAQRLNENDYMKYTKPINNGGWY